MAEDGTLYKNGESYYTASPKHHLQRNNSFQEQYCNKIEEQESSSVPIKRDSKCNSFSSEESADSPLDFSFKRKSIEQESSSGRDSAPSPSSTAETSSFVDERKHSDPEDVPYCNGTLQNGNIVDQKPELGEIRSSGSPGSNPGLDRMISAFNAGLVPPSTVLSVFPGIASLLDPRTQNNKSTRPFKTYPKDSLAVPYGAYPMSPGYNPFQGMDPSLLQNLNMSSEELMNLYKRQLNYMRDRNGHRDNSRNMSRTSPSAISSSSSPSATVTTNSIIQNINHPINGSKFSNGSIKHSQVQSTQSSPSGTPACSSSGTIVTSSSRKRPRVLPDEQKDEAYWERRRKNNDAAKRSRDARRAKEDEIAIKAALLEQENLKLRVEVAALKTETAKLRCMLYNS